MLRLTFSVLLLLATMLGIQAEIMAAYSAGGLAHKADLIAIATPLSVDVQKGKGDVFYTFSRFKLLEVIKGPLGAGDIVTTADRELTASDVPQIREALARQKQPEVLIFCEIPKESGQDELIAGKYTTVRLISPMERAVFFADQPVKHIYTEDFKKVSSYPDLLERARQQVKTEADYIKSGQYPGPTLLKRADIPIGTTAFKELYAASACFLFVPSYGNMTQEIIALSPRDASRLGKEPGFYHAATFSTDKTPPIPTNDDLFKFLKDLPPESAGLRLPDTQSAETFNYLSKIITYLHRRGVDVCSGSWLDGKLVFGPVTTGDE